MNKLMLGLLCSFSLGVFAQSDIQLMGFNPDLFRDGNLLKGLVISGDGQIASETITATLSHNGQVVARQTGLLRPGSVSLSDAQLIQSTFTTPYEQLLRQGLLPEGNYTLCIETQQGAQSRKCENYRHRVRPSPFCVTLVQPINNSELATALPTFTWSILAAELVGGLSSSIKITESINPQRKQIQHFSMPAHYQQSGMSDPLLSYPVSALPLKDGKQYNWNVDLLYNNALVCQSEVWNFRLPADSLKAELPINKAYIDLNQVSDQAEFFILGKLKLHLKTSLPEENVKITVFDSDHKPIKLKENKVHFTKSKQYGIYNFEENARLHHLKPYEVVIKSKTINVRLNMTYVNPTLYSHNN